MPRMTSAVASVKFVDGVRVASTSVRYRVAHVWRAARPHFYRRTVVMSTAGCAMGLVVMAVALRATFAPFPGQAGHAAHAGSVASPAGVADVVADVLRDAQGGQSDAARNVESVSINSTGWVFLAVADDVSTATAAAVCAIVARQAETARIFVVDTNQQLIRGC